MTEEKNGRAGHRPSAPGVILSASGYPDRFARILNTVSRGIATSVGGPGLTGVPLLEAVFDVVAVATREAVERGGDLAPPTKAIIMGVVRGSGATKGAALQILFHAARIILHHTARRNGNLAAAIKGVILGSIASARAMGVEPAHAASTAAQGGLAGASEAGPVTLGRAM
jgi:hypothetical protein